MKFSDYLLKLTALYTRMDRVLALAPPASFAHLEKLEEQCRFLLPPQLRAAWLSGNGALDGQVLFARPGQGQGYRLLTVKNAFLSRTALCRLAPGHGSYCEPGIRDPRIQSGWFHPGWLPFAEDANGTSLLVLDFSPSALGAPGQIIAVCHGPEKIDYLAVSFEQFLAESLELLRRWPQILTAPAPAPPAPPAAPTPGGAAHKG